MAIIAAPLAFACLFVLFSENGWIKLFAILAYQCITVQMLIWLD